MLYKKQIHFTLFRRSLGMRANRLSQGKGGGSASHYHGPLARGIMVKKNKFKLSNSSGKKSIMRNSNTVPNEKNVRSSNDSIFMANAEKNMDNQNHQNNSSGKNWNNLTKNQNKEVPSLSQDSGGLQILFLIKTPMTILIFSFFFKK